MLWLFRLLEKFNSEVNSTTNRVSAGIKRISELIDRSSSKCSSLLHH